MNGDLTIQTLETVEATGHALKAADDLLLSFDQEKRAAAELIGPTVKILKEAHLITDVEEIHATNKLASHGGAIEVVGNLVKELKEVHAEYRKKLAVAGQGIPLSEKVAGIDGANEGSSIGNLTSNSAPILGRRAGLGEKRASDDTFAAAFGVNVTR